jgi:predicted Zn finger-like uncharacterized protein
MIIECPVCTTRYNIELPPEGRTVRCAKCGNVWRGIPPRMTTPPKPDVPEAGTPDGQAGHTTAAAQNETREEKPAEEASSPHTSLAGDFARPANDDASGMQVPPPRNGTNAIPEERSAQIRAELAAAVPEWRDDASANEQSSAKVRWYGSFLKKNNIKPPVDGHGEQPAVPGGGSAAEPIPFPRLGPKEQRNDAAAGDLRTLEEAREAVRGVFASLEPKVTEELASLFPGASAGEKDQNRLALFDFDRERLFGGERQAEPGRSGSETMPALPEKAAPENNDTSDFGLTQKTAFAEWRLPASSGSDAQSSNAEDEPTADSHPWLKAWKQEARDDGDDPDIHLRNALRAHFPDRSGEAAEDLDHPGTPDETVQLSVIERFAASWRQPAAAVELAGELAVPAEDAGETTDGDVSFDRRLFREIEETQEHAKDRARRNGGGGLALAAAWGLFICVASGLLVGFFAFRDIAAGSIPGLAGLYRMLGTPVTVQPLIFESVQYDWSVEDYKPVLVIKGAVYNRGHRKVKVPDFAVTIKDDDPALDREYSANLNLNVSEIRPEQRGEFQIELQSPSPSITAVELELRNVR